MKAQTKSKTKPTESKKKQTKKQSKQQIENRWKLQKDVLITAMFSLAILVLALWGSKDFNQFLLFDDEFGYWTGSAYLTGTDWMEIANGIPYYSYGYGFLVLTPIRLLFSKPALMYQAALWVNGLLLVGSFLVSRKVMDFLYPDCNPRFRDFLCFLCQVYPSYLVFAHIAWAECLLVFVFWVFVWVSLRVIHKPSIANHVGLAASVVILYVVHQRTLAVMIATVMVMAWLFLTEKERRKDIYIFAIAFSVMIFIHSMVKTDLLARYYHSSSSNHRILFLALIAVLLVAGLFFVDAKRRIVLVALGVVAGVIFGGYALFSMDWSQANLDNARIPLNELSGQIGKLKSILTWTGFVNLLSSIMGKWFYLTMASFLLLWWSGEQLIRQSIQYLKAWWDKVRCKKTAEKEDAAKIWYVWLLLAFLGNFMIAAIYMIVTDRNDVLMYGRYTEHMIGIYIVIGVMCFLKDKKWLPKTIIYTVVAIVSGVLCENILHNLGMTTYQAYHSLYTSLFMQKGVVVDGEVIKFTIFAVIANLYVLGILQLTKEKKNRENPVRLMVPMAFVILACVISNKMLSGTMLDKQVLRIYNICTITDSIKAIQDTNHLQAEVYFCPDTESRYWSESFQFQLMEQPVHLMTSMEIEPSKEAFFIVGDNFVDREDFEKQYYCVERTYQFALVVNKNTYLEECAKKLKGE